MLKLDRFSCSQKFQLKQDPPVLNKYLSPDYVKEYDLNYAILVS